jgi:dipeptidyl aminopeptidase/acylaminoacyl peptidase
MTAIRFSFLAGIVLLAGNSLLHAADPAAKPADTGPISYYKQIRPIFQQHCQGCHQPAKPQGGYIMTSHALLLKAGDSTEPGVVPGKPEKSVLFKQLLPADGKPPAMPKGKEPLLERDLQLIRNWIAQGAKDDTPPSAREVVDQDHPPSYTLPPVITTIDYSPDGTLLAVSGYHEILLHKSDGSAVVARLVGLSERIQSLAFSPDGKLLAAAGGSPSRFGEIQVWDVEKRKLKLSVSMTNDTLYGVSWSPDGLKIGFGCGDNTLRAIDADGKQVLYQGAHSDWVLGTVFSQEGSYLISVSRDRSMKLTEVATQRMIDNITSITPGALKGGLAAVAVRPMKEKKMSKVPPDTPGAAPKPYDELLTGGADGTPRLYKMHREAKRVIGDDFNKIRDYEPMPGRIYDARFSADGKLFVAGSSFDRKGEVRVYQVDDGKRLSRCEGTYGPIHAVAFRPEGQQVATAGFDGLIRIYETASGKLIKEFIAVPLAAK